MAQKITKYEKIAISLVIPPALFIIVAFIILAFRFPIHDFNLWRLYMRYGEVALFHPATSELIEKKTYLGGPWELGSNQCIYAIGEFRRTRLSKQEIREAYEGVPELGTKIKPAEFEIYFPDDKGVSMESPIGDWFPEIRQEEPLIRGTDMKYLIYVAQERVFHWGDTRCLEW